uniref:Uncharacterized protein LOC113793227 n=1 Tax=Dermatophagoides pteronyssinus TaxID=6956 RepID=A0A6P6Y0E6_DERPT|nr:uncharacterized protein LOC113793227 [Dermatophagoides pteronyssinus]
MSSIVIVISFSLLIIVSFCGNTLVCRTLFRQRRFCANSTNVLIGMLAISDLMMTIFNIPFTVADIILNDWIFGDFVCILVSFVQANSVYVSSFTMAVIAIDRCKAIYKFRPKQTSNDANTTTATTNNNNHNDKNINGNAGTSSENIESSTNRTNDDGGGNSCCCLMDCYIFNILCPLFRSTNKSVHLNCSQSESSSKTRTTTTTTTRFKLELRTKMILIISAIWIMAALHSLPHTVFNRVTVIEVDNIIVDSEMKSTSNKNRGTNPRNDFKQRIETTDIAIIEDFNILDSDENSNYKYPISSSSSSSSTTTTTMIMEMNKTRTIRRCIPITPSWFGPKFSLWLTLYTTATQYIIPLSCAAIIYTRIAFTINSQGKVGQMTESRAEKINKHKRRRLLMLALIVAIFAICWLPFNVYYLLLDFGITKSYNHTAFLFCLWLATSSVCYNPFVYCWLNKSFRQEAKNVWNCLTQLFPCRFFCRCCYSGTNERQPSQDQNQFSRQNQPDQNISKQP